MSDGETYFAVYIEHTAEDCPINPAVDNSKLGETIIENLRQAMPVGAFIPSEHKGVAIYEADPSTKAADVEEIFHGLLPKHEVLVTSFEDGLLAATLEDPVLLADPGYRAKFLNAADPLFPGRGLARHGRKAPTESLLRLGDAIEETLRSQGKLKVR